MKKPFVLIAVAGLGAAIDVWVTYRGRQYRRGERRQHRLREGRVASRTTDGAAGTTQLIGFLEHASLTAIGTHPPAEEARTGAI